MYTAIFFNTDELIKLFGQVFINLFSHHSTIEFMPKETTNLPMGKVVKIKIIGRLTTDKLDVLLVENRYSKNKHPHITLSTNEGVKPFESNSEIANNLDKVEKLNLTLFGVCGLFKSGKIFLK